MNCLFKIFKFKKKTKLRTCSLENLKKKYLDKFSDLTTKKQMNSFNFLQVYSIYLYFFLKKKREYANERYYTHNEHSKLLSILFFLKKKNFFVLHSHTHTLPQYILYILYSTHTQLYNKQ